MKKISLWLWIILVLVIVSIAGIIYYNYRISNDVNLAPYSDGGSSESAACKCPYKAGDDFAGVGKVLSVYDDKCKESLPVCLSKQCTIRYLSKIDGQVYDKFVDCKGPYPF